MVIAKQCLVFVLAYGSLLLGAAFGSSPNGIKGDFLYALGMCFAGGSCLMYFLFPL